MKVVYRGNLPIGVEYNGIRYAMQKNKIIDMPIEAFVFAVASQHVAASEIIPYQEDLTNLQREVAVLRAANEELIRENQELREKLLEKSVITKKPTRRRKKKNE